MAAVLGCRAARPLPFFLMQALCIALFACAFNLLVAMSGFCPSATQCFSPGLLCQRHAAKVWGLDPALAILSGSGKFGAARRCDRRLGDPAAGIYFAMITLALSQMIYFFCLEAPFTHGEDGIQSVPQGRLLGLLDLSTRRSSIRRARDIPVRLSRDLPQPSIRRLAIFSRRSARTSRAPFRSATGSTNTSSPPSSSRRRSPVCGGATKAIFAQKRLADRRAIRHVGRGRADDLLAAWARYSGRWSALSSLSRCSSSRPVSRQWVTVIQGSIFVVCVLVFRRGIVGEVAAAFKRSL